MGTLIRQVINASKVADCILLAVGATVRLLIRGDLLLSCTETKTSEN